MRRAAASRRVVPRAGPRGAPRGRASLRTSLSRVILQLHHRYRHPGGEERAVADLAWLIRSELGEDVEVLERGSDAVGRGQAALGLLGGGLRPREVADAVRRSGARVVHAHNVHPTLGWRALAAAREAGARVVLHLHNYRLVCAVGTCFTEGADCTRCHGRDTRPGVRHNCRGSRAEAVTYAAALALQQRRLTDAADAIVVPSEFALDRLRTLGAPVDGARVLPSVQREIADRSRAENGEYVLAAGRLTPEKGFADVVKASKQAGLPLVVAGDGPELAALKELAGGGIRFAGRVSPAELAALRAKAAVAVVPSRYAEILPLAALEAMAAGLPVVAARSGGLADAVPAEGLYEPGDVDALAHRLQALYNDAGAGERALQRARERYAPSVIATTLRAIYDRN
jgi:glycosyltransferase involved in cell wall biosynthesis